MTGPGESPPLPVSEVLGELRRALADRGAAVLVAPPGTGKTTGVPPALLDEPWARDGRILVLEPRRLAARMSAARDGRGRRRACGRDVRLLGARRARARQRAPRRGRHRRSVRAASAARPVARGRERGAARRVPRALARHGPGRSRWCSTCGRRCGRTCGSSSCRPRSTRRPWRRSSPAPRSPAPTRPVIAAPCRRSRRWRRSSRSRRATGTAPRTIGSRTASRPSSARRCAATPVTSWCSCRDAPRSTAPPVGSSSCGCPPTSWWSSCTVRCRPPSRTARCGPTPTVAGG